MDTFLWLVFGCMSLAVLGYAVRAYRQRGPPASGAVRAFED
jgi:hypothetical protein